MRWELQCSHRSGNVHDGASLDALVVPRRFGLNVCNMKDAGRYDCKFRQVWLSSLEQRWNSPPAICRRVRAEGILEGRYRSK